MPFFYTEEKFFSEQSGELRYLKFWNGTWLIKVPEGAHYSGDYLENMWKTVPRRFVEEIPKNILVLGCGACRNINPLLKLWPDAEVDALDYDPVIVEIGTKIYGNFKNHKVNLIIADATTFVANTKKQYDLILVDIFYGNQPSPILKDEKFLNNLRSTLRNGGTVIANLAISLVERDEDVFQTWNTIFPESIPARYRGNKLAVARIVNIPADYYDIFQSKIYAESLRTRGFTVIGQPKSYYYIQRLPLKTCIVTAMHTDVEPDINFIKKETGLRHGLIVWSPWKKVFAEKPWRRNLLPPLHQKGSGLALVDKHYQDKWGKTTRQDLKKFKNLGASIKLVDKNRFIEGLNAATLSKSLIKVLSTMANGINCHDIEFWVTEKDNEILGGIAIINYDNISTYHIIYITKEGRDHQTGTGLMDWFHQHAIKNNIKYLNFGTIRQSGESRSWQGFSNFKRKFVDEEIVIKNQYFRFF